MSDIEFSRCSVCGQMGGMVRKYYYYDVRCDCCNGDQHFELVRHHPKCEPSPPVAVKLVLEIRPNE